MRIRINRPPISPDIVWRHQRRPLPVSGARQFYRLNPQARYPAYDPAGERMFFVIFKYYIGV
ncbi:MAG: hypothetical protein FWB94_03460 [Chitinispirillia bacterium]|nr:hypothetical protein [Chitinispirillia bacterium]